jgi:hypothetical protein
MKRTRIVLAAIALAGLGTGIAAISAHAGGRATVTIVSAPASVVAGKSFDLVFAVQPEWPMAKDRTLEPAVKAVCGDRVVTLSAVKCKDGKLYKASLALPSEGEWVITVDSHFCETRMKVLTLKASAASSTPS